MTSRSRILLSVGAGVVAAALALALVPAVAGAASSRPYCGITWGSGAKSSAQTTHAPLTGVRAGRHDCFDRLVFDIGGRPGAGYNVRYGVARAEGTGDPLSVAGGAVIAISLHAPAYDDDGNVTVPWRGPAVIRPDQFRSGGYPTFRHLVWGGTYEGYSSFGLGVRARLPFRVFQLEGPGHGTRLVIDVAHRW